MSTARLGGALGVLMMLASLILLVFAGLASASSLINQASVELDGDAHWWQQGSQDQSKVLSYNGYEYTIYYDAADGSGNVYPKVTRRTLSNNNLETVTLNTAEGRQIDPLDPHNTTDLGISPADGRLHIQWVMHNERIHYAISNERCLTEARFERCRFTWRGQTSNTRQEEKITYPEYFNAPDGTLYSGFRSGNGTGGDWVLHIYLDNGTWRDLGTILLGRSGTYDLDSQNGLEMGWNPSRRRGPYIDAAKFDSNGRLHLMWTWRETEPGEEVLNPLLAQHDIYYAYSDDGGLNWSDNSGTSVATNEIDPIRVEDSGTIAVYVRTGYWRANIMRMEIDRDNQPHIVMPTSDTFSLDLLQARIRQMHFWRTTDGVWHEQFIEPSEAAQQSFNIGGIQFDRANNMYVLYPKDQLGWVQYEAVTPRYNETLAGDHIIWDGRENLVIEPTSEYTGILTSAYIGLPIGGGATENRDLEIRVKNTTGDTEGKIYFTTDENQTWGFPQVKTFVNRNEGAYNTYTISMNGVTNWRGTLRALEFLPAARAAAGRGRITIDYIRLKNGNGTIVKEWTFNEGTRLYAAESAGADNWTTWELTQLLSGVNLSLYDATSFDIDERHYDSDHKITFPVLVQGEFGNERMRLYEYDVGGDEVAQQWGFGSDTIGWREENRNITGFGWASDERRGTIAGTISGGDARLVSPTLHLRLGRSSRIRVRMKNSRTATRLRGAVCWALNGRTGWRAEQCTLFNLTADNAHHIYEITPPAELTWREQELTSLRLDPSDNEEVRTGSFNVDYVRIVD